MPISFDNCHINSNLYFRISKKKKIDKTLLGFIRLRRNILLLAPFLCTSKGIGDYLRIHELVRLPFQPIQFYESCFIHREPDQTCDYLLLTRYPSSSTWEYPYHYLIDRNAIGSRPIRNWIYFPSPFFLFFFISINFHWKSSVNNSYRSLSGNFSLLCIGESEKKNFKFPFIE